MVPSNWRCSWDRIDTGFDLTCGGNLGDFFGITSGRSRAMGMSSSRCSSDGFSELSAKITLCPFRWHLRAFMHEMMLRGVPLFSSGVCNVSPLWRDIWTIFILICESGLVHDQPVRASHYVKDAECNQYELMLSLWLDGSRIHPLRMWFALMIVIGQF